MDKGELFRSQMMQMSGMSQQITGKDGLAEIKSLKTQLFKIITMPTTDLFRSKQNKDNNCEKCNDPKSKEAGCLCRGFVSLLQKSVHFKNKEVRNLLMGFILKVFKEEADMSTMVFDLDDFKELLIHANPLVYEFFSNTKKSSLSSIDWKSADIKRILARNFIQFRQEDVQT